MRSWIFRLSPIAASRPRVAKHRTYYVGPYAKWRQAVVPVIEETLGKGFQPLRRSLYVGVELYVTRPKTTILQVPRADVDNFQKAIYDSLNTKLWVDDTQIVATFVTKEWAQVGEEGYFVVYVKELTVLARFLLKMKTLMSKL